MSWFRGDFGNKCGTIKIAKKNGILPKEVQPSIDYQDYDWTLDIENFAK